MSRKMTQRIGLSNFGILQDISVQTNVTAEMLHPREGRTGDAMLPGLTYSLPQTKAGNEGCSVADHGLRKVIRP